MPRDANVLAFPIRSPRYRLRRTPDDAEFAGFLLDDVEQRPPRCVGVFATPDEVEEAIWRHAWETYGASTFRLEVRTSAALERAGRVIVVTPCGGEHEN